MSVFHSSTQAWTRAAVALLALLVTSPVLGQHSMAPMDHSKSKTKVVKGSDRPELIPDEEAYRLIFMTAAKNSSYLQGFPLSPEDAKVATRVIVNYQKNFQLLLDSQSKTYDPKLQQEFLAEANRLLKQTRDNLADKMTAEGYTALEAFVQLSKSAMTLTTMEEKQ